jgi:hypothetical protein
MGEEAIAKIAPLPAFVQMCITIPCTLWKLSGWATVTVYAAWVLNEDKLLKVPSAS